MPKTEAQKRAQERYAQSDKGNTALKKAHQKIADTEEYRAYQREKQKEYRQRRKLEASGKQQGETPINTEEVVPTERKLRLPTIKVVPEVEELLRSLPNRSEYIRDAVIEKLMKDGLLQPDQDSDSRGAA